MNKYKTLVVILLNEGEERKQISLKIDSDYLNIEIPEHSITTYVIS